MFKADFCHARKFNSPVGRYIISVVLYYRAPHLVGQKEREGGRGSRRRCEEEGEEEGRKRNSTFTRKEGVGEAGGHALTFPNIFLF